jgi:hypothetical protein
MGADLSRSGNGVVKSKDGGTVYLYQHCDAYDLPLALQHALGRGRPVWEDGLYLARVIFCEMVCGDLKGPYGYGISAEPWAGNVPDLIVDADAQTVTVEGWEAEAIPFGEFVGLDLGTGGAAMDRILEYVEEKELKAGLAPCNGRKI